MFSWGCFEITAGKVLGNIQKKRMHGEFLVEKLAGLQSLAYRTRNSTTNTFLEALMKEKVF